MRFLMRIHAKNVLLIEIISCNIICAQQLFIFNILHITLDIALRNRRMAKVEIVEHRMMCTVITPSLIHYFEMWISYWSLALYKHPKNSEMFFDGRGRMRTHALHCCAPEVYMTIWTKEAVRLTPRPRVLV